MSAFKDTNELYKVIGGFFGYLSQDKKIGPKLLASGLKIRFNYRDPDASIFIDLTSSEVKVFCGDKDNKADVEMNMKANTAHRFWQGKVNLIMALTRREITAKGPIPKILKLLPIIRPSYKMYPPYLDSIGYQADLS